MALPTAAALAAAWAPALPAAPLHAPYPATVDTLANRYWTAEYWAQRGKVKLYLYRKRLSAPQRLAPALPVVLFIHGSSLSSRTTYDLAVPGGGEYSMMNVFAAAGFDTWTMDFEGYGRSSSGSGNSDIQDGVADLGAAMPVLERETSLSRYHLYGESSGALRAAAFATAHPERVGRLVLTAFTYTGRGSPTLAQRARQIEYYRTHRWRKRDRAMIDSIFTRDKAGTTDPAVAAAVADAELKFGERVPTGTYLDMTAHLPLVQPEKLLAPALLLRGQYDGIATMEDLMDFFAKLACPDRQFTIIPNAAHALGMSINRRLLWYTTLSFLRTPPTQPLLDA
jgi:alpha-beta hydrolase superfamily lysophospholipase